MKIYKKNNLSTCNTNKQQWCQKHFSDVLDAVNTDQWKSIAKIITDFQVMHQKNEHAEEYISYDAISILSPHKNADEICYGVFHLVENGLLIEEDASI